MSTPSIAVRRRQAAERAAALRRHPTGRGATVELRPPPSTFYVIALVVTVFTMLGLVMVLSASSIRLFHNGVSPWRTFNRQVVWAILGAVALWLCARVPYQRLRHFVLPALVGSTVLMLVPFVPGVGLEVNDASSWVSLGSLSLQPSEFLKLAVLLYSADLLTRRADLGSAIVLAAIVGAVAFVGGTPLAPMTMAGVAGMATMGLFVVTSQRRVNRFTAFLDVAGNRDHLSYQTYQAMIAIAQGGTTGAGPGRGLNKLGDFLPLAHSDFIFAVVAEELGLIGVVAVVGGFLVLTYCGVLVANAAADRFGSLLAGGIVGWFVVQATINIGGVIGLMPVTGLTLPFFSAGGSSLFVCMAAAGLLLNVARHAK